MGCGRWLWWVRSGRGYCAGLSFAGGDVDLVVRHRDDRVGMCFAEHQVGAFLGVVGINWDVGAPGEERAEDGDVEFAVAGGHADSHAPTVWDTCVLQVGCAGLGGVDEFFVGEYFFAVVEGWGVGVGLRGGGDDVHERADWGSFWAAKVVGGNLRCGLRWGLRWGVAGAHGALR